MSVSVFMMRLLQDGLPPIAPTYLIISKWQFRLISFLPPVLCSCSVFGTLAILYRILKIDRYDCDATNRRSYHRLLVGMNICDLMACIAALFGTTPVPRDTQLEFARGNHATCTAQGFVIHTNVLSIMFYDVGLMIYFLLTIRYSWTERKVTKRVEPVIHMLALIIPWSIGVLAVCFKAVNPIGYGSVCGVASFTTTSSCESLRGTTCAEQEQQQQGAAAKLFLQVYNFSFLILLSILIAVLYVCIILIYCSVRARSRRAMSITSNRDRVRAQMRAVAVQSWLFALLFFNIWIYPVLSGLLEVTVKNERLGEKLQYTLTVLETFFVPLHGFFIFLIYIRPRFVRFRREENHSFCRAAKLAAFGGLETNLSSHRRRSSMILMQQQGKRNSNNNNNNLSFDRQSALQVSPITTTDGHNVGGSHDLTENEENVSAGAGFIYPEGCHLKQVVPCDDANDDNYCDVLVLDDRIVEAPNPDACQETTIFEPTDHIETASQQQ